MNTGRRGEKFWRRQTAKFLAPPLTYLCSSVARASAPAYIYIAVNRIGSTTYRRTVRQTDRRTVAGKSDRPWKLRGAEKELCVFVRVYVCVIFSLYLSFIYVAIWPIDLSSQCFSRNKVWTCLKVWLCFSFLNKCICWIFFRPHGNVFIVSLMRGSNNSTMPQLVQNERAAAKDCPYVSLSVLCPSDKHVFKLLLLLLPRLLLLLLRSLMFLLCVENYVRFHV